jgi:hypothetical protein
MNLVKISEDLKGVPLQALQAYMNGMNPEVPPYLAQAEMMRRQKAMEKQKLAEGAQGQMPSVKEQLEQSAGLMALQQQRQQQGMQQMAQQAQGRPMPAGEGVPQPERQPEGGVAALDIPEETFEMAGGGIVGYQAGGQTYTPMYQQAYRQGEQKGSIYSKDFGLPRPVRMKNAMEEKRAQLEKRLARAQEAIAQPDVNPTTKSILENEIRVVQGELALLGSGAEQSDARLYRGPEMMGITDQPAMAPAPTPSSVPAKPTPSAGVAYDDVDRMAKLRPAPPTPGMESRTKGAEDTGIAAVAPQMTPEEEARQMIIERMRQTPKAYTPAMAGEAEGKLAEQSGLAGLAGQREAMRKQREAMLKDRWFETFLATMAGGAQGGIAGNAAGYLNAKRTQRDADLAYEREMYGLDAAPAEKRYGTQGTLYREGLSRADLEKERQMDAAKLIAPTSRDKLPSSTETERILARVEQLKADGRVAEAEAYLDLVRKIKGGEQRGISDDQIRKMALEAAGKNSITDPQEMAEFVQTYMGIWKGQSNASTGGSAPSATTTTGTTMPSSPKALADQLKKQLGR